jgi:mannose-6-phosphate isomerase
MTQPNLTSPLTFEPLFMERVWGGRRLETQFGRRLPPGARIGESWEIVDRPEAQSVVHLGPLRGRTLHDLWTKHRAQIFGNVPETPRFPILAKLLDAQENLSLQVHPPPEMAAELGGEPKSEFWYVADAAPKSELFAGLKKGTTRAVFEKAIKEEKVQNHVHAIGLSAGDSLFLPSGRLHALGAGNLIIEIQQNSDTTYRVHDWDRVKKGGNARKMHIAEALRCIDFSDYEPQLLKREGEALVRHEFFHIDKWLLKKERELVPNGTFAIVVCLSGTLECGGLQFKAGEFFFMPAELKERTVRPAGDNVSLLRVTAPQS